MITGAAAWPLVAPLPPDRISRRCYQASLRFIATCRLHLYRDNEEPPLVREGGGQRLRPHQHDVAVVLLAAPGRVLDRGVNETLRIVPTILGN